MAPRLEHAQRVAARYAAEAEVLGVQCVGSVGRGHPDRWSDLELAVFWARPPDEGQRAAVIDDLGGFDTWPHAYDPVERLAMDVWWLDGPECNGLQVEICHLTAVDADALLDRLLVDLHPDPYLLGFAAALAYGRPLQGDVDRWRNRVAGYPAALAAVVAYEFGRINHFWRWRMFVERANPHGLAAHFADVAQSVEHVLYALNRRWWPGTKWPGWMLPGLSIAPPDVAARLRAAAVAPPEEAAAELTSIVDQTHDLVERHLPEADPARLREIFRLDRAPWPP